LNIIINEVSNRFQCIISDSPSQIPFGINHVLSPNVKKSMNKHNLNYSMTSSWDESIEYIVINKRADSNWYSAVYKINRQPEEKSSNSEKPYHSYQYSNHSKQSNSFWKFVKVVIAIAILVVIFNQCHNQQPTRSQPQTVSARNAQTFATVIGCYWLNVRRTPSSVNSNNIIEAIRVNTRVEVLERQRNGWVRIRYGNGRIGYVHSNFLSR